MRTTLNIEDELLAKAHRVSGVKERTALVREGLKALIERESARRLAKLGGTEPRLRPVPRRRSDPACSWLIVRSGLTTCAPVSRRWWIC